VESTNQVCIPIDLLFGRQELLQFAHSPREFRINKLRNVDFNEPLDRMQKIGT